MVKAIAKRKNININKFNSKKVFELYDSEDEIAIEEFNKFFTYIAIVLINIQYTYDPEAIVIGGTISERK